MRIPVDRRFRLLLSASIVSQLGDWSARLAIALLVLERTGAATAVGATAALFVLPWIGVGQWLAARAARFDGRKLLVACDTMRGLVFLAMVVEMPIPVLMLLILIAATIDPIFEANKSSLVVDVVANDDYPDAIVALHSTNQLAQLVGFGAGGLIVTAIGTEGAVAANAGTFFISAILIAAMGRSIRVNRTEATSGSLSQALSFLRDDHISRIAFASTIVLMLAAIGVEMQAPVFGSSVVGLNQFWIGILAATIPAGLLITIWSLKTEGSDETILKRGALLMAGAGATSSVLLAFGTTAVFAFAGHIVVGVALAFSTVANIAVGRRIPANIRAGCFAVLQGAVFIAHGAGSVLGGVVSDLTTPRAASAGLMLVPVFAGLYVLRFLSLHASRELRHGLEAPTPAARPAITGND